MLHKRWKIREVEDNNSLKSLADSLNISDILAKLLLLRDIKSFAEAITCKVFTPTGSFWEMSGSGIIFLKINCI